MVLFFNGRLLMIEKFMQPLFEILSGLPFDIPIHLAGYFHLLLAATIFIDLLN